MATERSPTGREPSRPQNQPGLCEGKGDMPRPIKVPSVTVRMPSWQMYSAHLGTRLEKRGKGWLPGDSARRGVPLFLPQHCRWSLHTPGLPGTRQRLGWAGGVDALSEDLLIQAEKAGELCAKAKVTVRPSATASMCDCRVAPQHGAQLQVNRLPQGPVGHLAASRRPRTPQLHLL